MNGRSWKYLILVTVCVTNFEEKNLDFIKNTTTDKKEQVRHDILALVVFACVVKLHIQDSWCGFSLIPQSLQSTMYDLFVFPGKTELKVWSDAQCPCTITLYTFDFSCFWDCESCVTWAKCARDHADASEPSITQLITFCGKCFASITRIPYMHRSSRTLLMCRSFASWYICLVGPIIDLHNSLALRSAHVSQIIKRWKRLHFKSGTSAFQTKRKYTLVHGSKFSWNISGTIAAPVVQYCLYTSPLKDQGSKTSSLSG